MRWAVEVQKTSLTRRNLVDLVEGVGFRVVSGISYPAITSAAMQRCETAADVFVIAKRLRGAIVGAARVDEEFRLGSVIDFASDPPSRHGFVEAHGTVHRITGHVTLQVSPPKGLTDQELALWKERQAEKEYQAALERQLARLEPAFRDERAEKVLELLEVPQPTGETLYKIYERLEGHPGNRPAFQARFGISPTEFTRFKDTVHNASVSGDWARHAYQDTPKSPNPMSKAEAESLVRQLAARWLADVRRSG